MGLCVAWDWSRCAFGFNAGARSSLWDDDVEAGVEGTGGLVCDDTRLGDDIESVEGQDPS